MNDLFSKNIFAIFTTIVSVTLNCVTWSFPSVKDGLTIIIDNSPPQKKKKSIESKYSDSNQSKKYFFFIKKC